MPNEAQAVDDDLLERRMRDWKQSEQLARDAERAAASTPEPGPVKPLAQRAAQLRRIADVILASILEDMHIGRPAERPGVRVQDSRSSPST